VSTPANEVVFYNPQSNAARKPIVPLALLEIGAVTPWPHSLVDGNLVDPIPALDQSLSRIQGRKVLAVTVMPGPQLADALPVCRELKRRHPDASIVWGGYFPTQHWEVTARTGDFLHAVVRGHGEEAFPAVLEAIAAGAPMPRVPGLAWRERGEVQTTGRAPVPKIPPLIPFESLDLTPYVRSTTLGRRTLGYHSSYGCPFHCNFCAVVTQDDGAWNAQPADQVAAVFRHYRERYGCDSVELYDNNFFVAEKRVRAFAKEILDLGMSWWGEARVDTLMKWSDDTWRLMAASGLKMVFLGAESGSAETLARMDKGGTLKPEDTLALVARMQKIGVIPELSFVLGNPPDPEGDLEGTLAFIRKVKRINPKTEIILYLYSPEPVPGALLDAAVASGFRYPESLDAWVSGKWASFAQRRTAHSWLRPSLRGRLKDFERVLNAYYPTSTDVRLRGPTRWLLRGMAGWRWHTETYRMPVELAALQRAIRYQRPETSGF
jgi:hypothetical protein